MLTLPATGGTGADLFNFSGGGGHDVVTDFSRAEGDHIRISPSDAANFSALSGHITSQGADTLITLGAQTVLLVGVSAGSLTAAAFVRLGAIAIGGAARQVAGRRPLAVRATRVQPTAWTLSHVEFAAPPPGA